MNRGPLLVGVFTRGGGVSGATGAGITGSGVVGAVGAGAVGSGVTGAGVTGAGVTGAGAEAGAAGMSVWARAGKPVERSRPLSSRAGDRGNFMTRSMSCTRVISVNGS